jgi:hypothetical protein
MKNRDEILPPDTHQIDKEVDDLFTHGDITSVSNWSGIRYSRLAAMLRIDDPQENCVTETFKVWYGMTKNDREKGKRLFRMFERQAAAMKLFDGSPFSTLQDVIQMVQRIKPEDIRRMDEDKQLNLLAFLTILQDAIEGISKATCKGFEGASRPIGG